VAAADGPRQLTGRHIAAMPLPALNRILYVEDEPDIQAVAKLALEMIGGFTVELCSSGQEAVRKAATFQPDLVLLDVMMPGMDGPTIFQALRKQPQTAAVPIAFMTAKVQTDEVERYTGMGAIGFVAKPFDPMKLADTVKRLWKDHHERS
jgi:two-component system, OmpR family, response regulator